MVYHGRAECFGAGATGVKTVRFRQLSAITGKQCQQTFHAGYMVDKLLFLLERYGAVERDPKKISGHKNDYAGR